MEKPINGSWAAQEMSGLSLPDKRFSDNVIAITESISNNIGQSFSSACGQRLRKSAWRLFSKQDLSLLSSHQQQALQRCAEYSTILIVEDTTDVVYIQKQKQGMGSLGGQDTKGLNMHTALALSPDGAALGIIFQKIWAPTAGRGKVKRATIPIAEKESIKWIQALGAVDHCWSGKQQQVILIADREADFFEHYAQPRKTNVDLLVRVNKKKREVCYKGIRISINELLSQLQPLGSGQVKVWRRPNQPERLATVSYSLASVIIPPTYNQTLPAQQMNLVWVREQQGIEWILLTSLPVNTLEDAITIAGYYAQRWVVERFHFILKSGLHIESLQIDTFTRLHNALQVYALVAWHLLWLYRLGKYAQNEAAEGYFDAESIEVLETISHKPIKNVKEFLIRLGELGGFHQTTKQPLPGEKTLWQGVRQLIQIRTGFLAAKLKYGTG